MKTLEKTMTEFVLEKEMSTIDYDEFDYYQRQSQNLDLCLDYAKLLSTPLTLGMFVCVDEDGNVLEEPKNVNYQTDKMFDIALKRYKKALSNVFFKGFEKREVNEHGSFVIEKGEMQIAYYKAKPNYWIWNFRKIEDLIPHKLKLTDNFTID